MKLSMWMIANRLSPLIDITTEISPDAKATLNSARLVYATNCVHVYEEKGSVVCSGEGDRIRMAGITLKEAFEMVQGVFDYFQDWEELIREKLSENDFQTTLDECEILFQNPMLIMDANNQVLAMSKHVEEEKMDEEWRYLKRYGYSSLDSISLMNYMTTADFTHNGFETFFFKKNQQMQYGGLTYNLQFDDVYCGRITILEKERKVNPGDFQLLEKIASLMSPILGAPSYGENEVRPSVFYDLLFGSTYNDRELSNQMNYYQWKFMDSFQVAVLMPEEKDKILQSLKVIRSTVSRQLPRSVVLLKAPCVVVLYNQILTENVGFLELLRAIGSGRKLYAGYSLIQPGLAGAAAQYEQAVNAIQYGRKLQPGRRNYYFKDYGAEYLLDAGNSEDRIWACHPVVRQFWQRKQESGEALYDTLREFLDQERSLSRTAEALFTHRNTVLYRIKKCQELLDDDLETAGIRYYIRMSMYYLEKTESGTFEQPEQG